MTHPARTARSILEVEDLTPLPFDIDAVPRRGGPHAVEIGAQVREPGMNAHQLTMKSQVPDGQSDRDQGQDHDAAPASSQHAVGGRGVQLDVRAGIVASPW